MKFSLFENDNTLGMLDSRVVVLRGSTTVSQLFSPNFFPIDNWLKTALELHGFSVIAVRSSAAGWVGYSINIEIELNVFNNFTSEQARRNAIQAIEAYTANYGLNKVFSNTTLSVAFDAYVPAGGNGGIAPIPQPSPPSSYDRTNPGSTSGGSDFFGSLGMGLGLSGPVVIGGAVLVAFLILRR